MNRVVSGTAARIVKRLPVLIMSVFLLSACGWFGGKKEQVEVPAELVDFQQVLDVKRIWRINIGKGNSNQGISLAPAFDSGRVFAADYRGNILAVDAETGKQQWRAKTKLPISAGPSAAEGLVLVGTLEGTVHALDGTSGAQRWQARVSSEVLSTPVLHDNVVIVRCIDGRVFGLDRNSGDRLWIFDQAVPRLTLRGNSTPLARAGIVYIGYDGGQVVALRAEDGSEIWNEPLVAPQGRSELERLVDFDGRMALVASDLYVANYKSTLLAVAANNGNRLWFKDVGSATGVVVDRLRLALSDNDGSLWLLDRRSGATLWKQDMLEFRGLTRPAIYGNYVVVGDMEGYLHWFDIETGNLVARSKTDKDGLASAPLSVGTTLYVLANNGDLVAYRAGAAI